MDVSKENSRIIEELQIIEQQLQGILAQKQMFQVELQEIENALKELSKTNDEVYKILSGAMIKKDKNEMISELEERKKLIDLRISTLEKQEKIVEEKSLKIRDSLKRHIHK